MHNRFSILVHGPKSGKVLMKLEDVGVDIPMELEDAGDTPSVEKPANYTNANEWQYLEFDFTGVKSGVFDRLTLFFDFGVSDTNTYYFDDIRLLPADTIYISQSNIDAIIEGSEDGMKILVNLKYDQFVEVLTPSNWNFLNLPEGVTVGDIQRISQDSVILILNGNSTIDYDKDITNFTTHVKSSELKKSKYDLSASKGVKFKANIEDFVKNKKVIDIVVAPNLIDDHCKISSSETIDRITIFNLQGVVVKQLSSINEDQYTIKFNNFPKGMYLIEIQTQTGKNAVKSIVIK